MSDKISDFYCEVADSDPPCAEIVKLREQLAQAKAELAALHTELELLTHKLITCGVAASHPDANLAHTKAYAQQWNSPQAEDVRILRADRDALRAECERLREDTKRLLFIIEMLDGIGDIDFYEQAAIYASALGREEPNDNDYIAAIRDAIDAARKDQP